MKRKGVLALVLVLLATFSVRAFLNGRDGDAPQLVTSTVSRGDVVTVVSASGTLEAVTTVAVGTQVSGSISALNADFNDLVKKGQVLAKLEPSTFQTALDQARANLVSAQADAERLRVAKQAADVTLARSRELAAKQLIPAMDLQTAEVDSRSAAAQLTAAEAKIAQARAAVQQADVSLSKTIITSPIDGVVIARDVDLGQTVAASLQAPTLFTIAADLSQMRVNATIDESDVGQLRDGQSVSFTVDAYPTEVFKGTVEQVRLNSTVTQNVVTYSAMVNAPNPQLKLKPGMTANLTIEVARRDDVLRVPTTALRFTPSADVLARFGAKRPEGRSTSGLATVWRQNGALLEAVRVRTGLSDNSFTEVLDGSLPEGASIVTQIRSTSAQPSAQSTRTSNPLMSTGGPPGPPPR